MANNYIYGYSGPPFNFLGHHSQSQQTAFQDWVNARKGNLAAVQQFHQIRAAQLRKTSGALEQFYRKLNDEPLAPTFKKPTWQPGPQGYFPYQWREDHLPMVAMAQVKDYMREQLQRQDEAVFHMNHARNLIEKQEDKAENAFEALNHPQRSLSLLLTKINSYFKKPEYDAVLVNDTGDVYPAGSTQPRFRVHQLDAPTQWEIEQAGRAAKPGAAVVSKEELQH
jgi:hypothetical protein